MSNPGEPQRPQQDPGYYGAGWSQPAPPAAPQRSGPPVWGPQAPVQQAVPPRQHGAAPGSGADPRRAFAPGASVTNTTGALIAVVSLVLVEFVAGVVGLLGTALVVHPFSSYGAGESLLSGFVTGVFLSPFPFYAGAFLCLAFLTPIARRSPLPTVLLRAVLAGAGGTVAMALVGLFTGTYGAVRSGAARLVVDVVATPLRDGLPFTLMLLGSATVAWLWLGRPRGGAGAPGARGLPGTVRPADAVPPATVQQQYGQPQAPQQPYGQGPDRAQQPYGQQPYGAQQQTRAGDQRADGWGGPALR